MLPGIIPFAPAISNTVIKRSQGLKAGDVSVTQSERHLPQPSWHQAELPPINFVADSELLSAGDYISRLARINSQSPIQADSYGNGGSVQALEKNFEVITGK